MVGVSDTAGANRNPREWIGKAAEGSIPAGIHKTVPDVAICGMRNHGGDSRIVMHKCDVMQGCKIAHACLPFLDCCSFPSALNARATQKDNERRNQRNSYLDACRAGRPENSNGPAVYKACIPECTATMYKHNGCSAGAICDLIRYIGSTQV